MIYKPNTNTKRIALAVVAIANCGVRHDCTGNRKTKAWRPSPPWREDCFGNPG